MQFMHGRSPILMPNIGIGSLLGDTFLIKHGSGIDRSAAFDVERAQHCVLTLLMGTRARLVPYSLLLD
jgi:hypothetical protein